MDSGEHMLDSNIVGKVVKEFRKRKGLSQEILSGLAGIGRTHLSMIERGTRKPTLETLFRICDALSIPPENMVKEISKRNTEDR